MPVLDENECNATTYPCHEDAFCNNTVGSFECICEDGFTGNGTFCRGLLNVLSLLLIDWDIWDVPVHYSTIIPYNSVHGRFKNEKV